MSSRISFSIALALLLALAVSADLAAQGKRGGKGGGHGRGGGQGYRQSGGQRHGQQHQYRYQYRYRQGMQGGGGMQGMQGMHGMKGMKGGMKGMQGMMGMAGDPRFQADREMFHFLLSNGKKIRRQVKMLENGIETVTESNDPKVAAVLKKHVASMYDRLEQGQPVRMGDPLFRALFQNADKITMEVKQTKKGVHVVETSDDPYVVKLLQAHAKVVSQFAKRGFQEAMKMHPVPKGEPGRAAAGN